MSRRGCWGSSPPLRAAGRSSCYSCRLEPAWQRACRKTRHASHESIGTERAAEAIDPAWFPEGDNIRVGDEIIVDIMLNANGQTYESLKPFAQMVDVQGVAVRTVSLEGLLLTKRTMRSKDLEDCAVIERALAVMAKSGIEPPA